jgi:integrase
MFDSAATKASVGGLAPHELRHTCASLAIRSRASIKTAQRLPGHATATMTLDNYGHLYPDELDQVAQQMGGECVYPGRTEESQKEVDQRFYGRI